jgi:hypothetical protein
MLLAMLTLFAQVGRQAPPKGLPPEVAAAFATAWLAILCVGVALSMVFLTIAILHMVGMHKALSAVRKRNRTMEPGMVFLSLVPFLNIIWPFLVVIRVADSLRNEFEDRGWDTKGETFGYGIGLTAVILNLAMCGFVGMILLIVHWRQIAGYTRQLVEDKRRR